MKLNPRLSPDAKRRMRIEKKLADAHREARRTALGLYIRDGFVPPELKVIVAATRSLAELERFSLIDPRGSPDKTRV